MIPVNDGEAVEIRNILTTSGEQVLITGQPWGATWAGLEPALVARLRELRNSHSDAIIYGIEIGGTPNEDAGYLPVINIDHHRYRDDDRTNPSSSIEQVATLLEVTLTRYQRFVAANDVGYIPRMLSLGAELGMSATDIAGMIKLVRAADRCAQGVTPDDEAQAVRDVQGAVWSNGALGRRVMVSYTTPSTTAHADLLYGKAVEELFCGPKWIYFGPRHQELYALNLHGSWAGGAANNGYFGVVAPDMESRNRIMKIFNS